MKALTISQPYASLIAMGGKWVENRDWPTRYRGELVIHAGKGTQYMTRKAMRMEELPCGAIIAIATVIGCVSRETVLRMSAKGSGHLIPDGLKSGYTRAMPTALDLLNHEHFQGPYGFVLAHASRLAEPIPCNGRLGIWNLPDELVSRVMKTDLLPTAEAYARG